MNLEDNVAKIKDKIRNSFHKRLVRLGIRDDQINARDEEDPDFKKAKAAVEAILEDEESFEEARGEYLDEVTFTLFNRIAGIKTMEAESRQLVPEIIQIRAQHGDKSFAHNVWLEENTVQSSETLEGLDNFIRAKFNELSDELPLYSKENPYDLLPEVHDLKDIINLFNDEISLDDWRKDDILGWLYESYNKKDYQDFKESGDKIEWDKLSLSSQMYTPRWVVEFLVNNSLGKYWLEINPDSKIREKHDIANAPDEAILEPKNVEEIKVIDPASGSGNFLLYSFELLAEIYEEEGYAAEEIPALILKNNLFGLDIDERAVQIARLQLYIKAKTDLEDEGQNVDGAKLLKTIYFLEKSEDLKRTTDNITKLYNDELRYIGEIKEDFNKSLESLSEKNYLLKENEEYKITSDIEENMMEEMNQIEDNWENRVEIVREKIKKLSFITKFSTNRLDNKTYNIAIRDEKENLLSSKKGEVTLVVYKL